MCHITKHCRIFHIEKSQKKCWGFKTADCSGSNVVQNDNQFDKYTIKTLSFHYKLEKPLTDVKSWQ